MQYASAILFLAVTSVLLTYISIRCRSKVKVYRDKHEQNHTSLPSNEKRLSLHTKGTQLEKDSASTLTNSNRYCASEDLHTTSPLSPIVVSPLGLSQQQIESLGDFPDYAQLSGVPLPQPYHHFDINKAKPRPYRPLRWVYHQTMSLMKMEPDWWLELESNYKDRIKQRLDLFDKHGKDILNTLPGSESACKELLGTVIQFLCARYPHHFSYDIQTCLLKNKILNRCFSIKEMDPLIVILNNVPEDFLIVLKNPETQKYHLRAGVCCSSIGWNVGTKIGKSLSEIHAPVPDYKEKMSMSMDRYFSKLQSDKPIQRGSWSLEIGQPLFFPANDTHWKARSCQSPTLKAEDIHMRVDWQTLRRLPVSNAIVFNFKCLFTPITEFRNEPYIPSLVLKNLKEGKENLMKEKGTWHVEHVAIPVLEGYIKEQEESGVYDASWDVGTLPESPFYPGWQSKWHAQQGY